MEKEWVVWCPSHGAPSVRHSSLDSAKKEAERLARQNPTSTFMVLEIVGSCQKTDVSWDWSTEIPF